MRQFKWKIQVNLNTFDQRNSKWKPRAKVKIVDRKVDTKRSKYQVWSLTLPCKDPQWYAEY